MSLLQVLALPMLWQALLLLPISYATRYFGALSGTNLQPIWYAGQGGWEKHPNFGRNTLKNIAASGKNVNNNPFMSVLSTERTNRTHKYIAQHNAVVYISTELRCKFIFTNCLVTQQLQITRHFKNGAQLAKSKRE
jgi:hypothetical protein